MKILLDYPWYFVLFCLLLGVGYSALLYFFPFGKKAAPKDSSFSKRTRLLLAALRCVCVSLIAFLLLSPMVKREVHENQKPIVVVAQDNSKSILYAPDSAFYRGDYAMQMHRLVSALSEKYDVVSCVFDEDIRTLEADEKPDYKGQSTNIERALASISEQYRGRNLGAVVLASDGIFNAGANPATLAHPLPCPVFSVAMGDTTRHRDAAIANLRYNHIAFLGNKFPLEVSVHARQLQGVTRQLSVSHKGKVVASQAVQYTGNDFITDVQFLLPADAAGLQTYTVSIAPADGEHTLRNNSRTIAVEVVDGHQKIAIVADAPHPDVGALRRAIAQNQNYEVSSFLARDFKGRVDDFDLVILHGLPSSRYDVRQYVESRTPLFFVLSANTNLEAFNALRLGVEVRTSLQKQVEVTPALQGGFAHFSLDGGTAEALQQMPPLVAPFGEYKCSPQVATLFAAKVGNIVDNQPLVAFSQQQTPKGQRRTAFLVGEGIWRWALADYASQVASSNAEGAQPVHVNELVDKMVTFTASQANREQLHLNAQTIYSATEPVNIECQLLDDNYQPTIQPDVAFVLSRVGGGEGRQYQFGRTASTYTLSLGVLDTGLYTYQAVTRLGEKKLSASGRFAVEGLSLEDVSTVADHSMLNTLAATTGGVCVAAHDLERVTPAIDNLELKPMIYSHAQYTDMLNLFWVFLLILILLACEWIIRKYNGVL